MEMGFSHVSFTEKFSLLVQALVKELTIIKLNNYPYQLAEMFPEKAGWLSYFPATCRQHFKLVHMAVCCYHTVNYFCVAATCVKQAFLFILPWFFLSLSGDLYRECLHTKRIPWGCHDVSIVSGSLIKQRKFRNEINESRHAI